MDENPQTAGTICARMARGSAPFTEEAVDLKDLEELIDELINLSTCLELENQFHPRFLLMERMKEILLEIEDRAIN